MTFLLKKTQMIWLGHRSRSARVPDHLFCPPPAQPQKQVQMKRLRICWPLPQSPHRGTCGWGTNEKWWTAPAVGWARNNSTNRSRRWTNDHRASRLKTGCWEIADHLHCLPMTLQGHQVIISQLGNPPCGCGTSNCTLCSRTCRRITWCLDELCVTSDLSTAMWTCRSVSLLDLLETLNTVLLETLNTVSNWCLKGLYLFSGRWTKTSYLHLRQTGVVCLLK